MGFKSLNLQVIPWCFHVVRATRQLELDGDNDDLPHNPRLPTSSLTRPVRVIGSDDRIRIYNRPMGAAEVMKENPRLLVCRSDSFFIDQQVPPLPPATSSSPATATSSSPPTSSTMFSLLSPSPPPSPTASRSRRSSSCSTFRRLRPGRSRSESRTSSWIGLGWRRRRWGRWRGEGEGCAPRRRWRRIRGSW